MAYTYDDVMQKLESLASHDPKDLAGMARFGIRVDKAWVISMPKLRKLAKEIKKDVTLSGTKGPGSRVLDSSVGPQNDEGAKVIHELALQIWDSGVHEARILAGLIDIPELVTEQQMEKWALDFDSWDVVDAVCGNLFDRTKFAVRKATEWSSREEEFVKRAGFVIMAWLAVHNKKLPDAQFIEFLKIIKRESGDNRNFVRKAINWALRQIGKSRNKFLYDRTLDVCDEILHLAQNDKTEKGRAARFIAGDAKRELEREYIKKKRFGIE